jgi:hypothetical protein
MIAGNGVFELIESRKRSGPQRPGEERKRAGGESRLDG